MKYGLHGNSCIIDESSHIACIFFFSFECPVAVDWRVHVALFFFVLFLRHVAASSHFFFLVLRCQNSSHNAAENEHPYVAWFIISTTQIVSYTLGTFSNSQRLNLSVCRSPCVEFIPWNPCRSWCVSSSQSDTAFSKNAVMSSRLQSATSWHMACSSGERVFFVHSKKLILSTLSSHTYSG